MTVAVAGATALVGVGSAWAAARDHAGAAATPTTSLARRPVLTARRLAPALSALGGAARLRADLDEVLAQPDLDTSRDQSCLAVSEGGRMRYAHRVGAPVMPASTLKTLVAGAALATLGPDFRFVTLVRAAGPPAEGVLTGDLWFVGGGDPLLSTDDYLATFPHQPQKASRLEDLADSLVAAGVRDITGRVIGDDRRYDRQRAVPTWKRSYQTRGEVGPLAGLTVNDNFTAGEPGRRRSSPEPGAGAAAVLIDLLEARGVTVRGEAAHATPDDPAAEQAAPYEVARLQSLPLSTIIAELLEESDNTTAELLLKELARHADPATPGSTTAGLTAIRGLIASWGLPAEEYGAVDASGLDRGNRVTCRLLVAALDRQPLGGPLVNGLAVAGETGTLSERFLTSAARGRLRAKTGSLNGVSSLVGVLPTGSGRVVRFALVMNEIANPGTGLAVGAQVVEAMLAYPEGPTEAELSP